MSHIEHLADLLYAHLRDYKVSRNPKVLEDIKTIADEIKALDYKPYFTSRGSFSMLLVSRVESNEPDMQVIDNA